MYKNIKSNFGGGHWNGFVPPQYVYSNRKFKGVAVNPPNFIPGSWCGAGKAIYDSIRDEYILTSRPRESKNNRRGFAAEIYISQDGLTNFTLNASLSKEKVAELAGMEVASIEGTQLLRDPLTKKWHFYLSIDVGKEFVWGGMIWQTLLLTSSKLCGPWISKGVVLKNDREYDAHQARDGSIDIIDGRYFCIYKAKDKESRRRPGLAISKDGISWDKPGALTIDGEVKFAFLSGSLFPGVNGPVFLGVEMLHETDEKVEHEKADKHGVKHGSSLVRFCSYNLDYRNLNLETIFRTSWEPSSPFEHKIHPLLGYSSSLYDPKQDRILMYLEAIDGNYTKKMGLNHTVERVLVYETKL